MVLGALLGALAAGGCITEPATQLLVAVDTDVADPALLGAVDVEVQDPRGATVYDRATFRVSPTRAAPGVLALPFTFGVAPHSADAGDVRVVVRGRSADGAVRLSSTTLAGYRRNRALVLPVFLARACVDRACPDDGTCVDGACVPVTRADPASLQDVTGLAYAPPSRDAGAPVTCAEGQRACDGRCVDPLTDTFHCGACGHACADGNRCEAGGCVSFGQCGPPYLPAGSTQCAADYNTGECGDAGLSTGCTTMPEACATARGSMPARSYANRWAGDVITFPRPVRRLRFSFGGASGAGCWLRLLDDTGASLLQPEPHANCTHPTMPTPGADVDFTAPASSAGVTRLWLNHISSSTCYLSALELSYDP